MIEKSKKLENQFVSLRDAYLSENNTVMSSKEGQYAVCYSEKPLQPGDLFLIEIEEIEEQAKFKYISVYPIFLNEQLSQINSVSKDRLSCGSIILSMKMVENEEKILLTNDVKTSRGVIPFEVLNPKHIIEYSEYNLPVGSRIGVTYDKLKFNKRRLYYIVNGKIYTWDFMVPYSEEIPLHVKVRLAGGIKKIRIVQFQHKASFWQSICNIIRHTKDIIYSHLSPERYIYSQIPVKLLCAKYPYRLDEN